jgi:hypothetical protein
MGMGWCGGGVWPLDGGSAGVGVWMGFGDHAHSRQVIMEIKLDRIGGTVNINFTSFVFFVFENFLQENFFLNQDFCFAFCETEDLYLKISF